MQSELERSKQLFLSYQRYLQGFFWLLFVCFAAYVGGHHEFWRDEMQAWSIAREAGNFRELMAYISHEGHTVVWFFILYAITRFSSDPIYMQVVHLAFSAISVYLILFKAPFPLVLKLLIVFGYYFLYEYTIICRPYALAVLSMLVLAHNFDDRWNKPVKFAVIVALVAQTNVLATIFAIAISISLFIENLVIRKQFKLSQMPWKIYSFLLGAIALAIYDTKLPENSSIVNVVGFSEFKWRDPLILIFKAFVRNAQPGLIEFWDSYRIIDPATQSVIGLIITVVLMLCLYPSKLSLLVFTLSTIGYLLLFVAILDGYPRHFGFIYISFIVAIWIRFKQNDGYEDWLPKFASVRLLSTVSLYAFLFLLSFQILAVTRAVQIEIAHPFSNAKRVALMLEEGVRDIPVVASRAHIASTVAGFTGDDIYYLDQMQFGTFIVWLNYNIEEKKDQELINEADSISLFLRSDLYFLHTDLLPSYQRNYKLPVSFRIKGKFNNSIASDETYKLYFVEYDARRRPHGCGFQANWSKKMDRFNTREWLLAE